MKFIAYRKTYEGVLSRSFESRFLRKENSPVRDSYASVRTTSRDEMKFAQMYHAEAFPEIFRVSVATMAIVISMYTPLLFDRVCSVPLSRWQTLALRGPLLQVMIIKAQISSIKTEPSDAVEKLR